MRHVCLATRLRLVVRLAVAAFVLVTASAAGAQTVTNPTTLQFTASPDHSATSSDGQALVSRHDLSFYTVGGRSPLCTYSLGKPTPDGAGNRAHRPRA